MKFSLKYIFAIIAMAILFISCNNSDDTLPLDELKGLTKIKEITNETHIIELYSATGTITQGYNDIKLRFKNKATNQYEKNVAANWLPLMHMMTMNHSCPKSSITKVSNEGSLYEGYIMFQMAQNSNEYWDLKIDYIINGANYTANSAIDVPATAKRTVNVFNGSDGVRYLVAYIQPQTPKVALNKCIIGIWKMQDMMNFPLVDGYTVKLDPRMPSMGNHGSPNNVNATQSGAGQLYNGQLSLTMTGYWKINLQLLAPDGTLLKGEEITDANPESSIFFEIEF